MALGSYKISDLLEKMQNSDKDFRFMATNDLINELERDSIKLDDESERKVVKALLKLLDDKNGEVQNLVVRCLALLINKIKEGQVDMIVKTLCTNMVSEKEQLRDISSVGLKAVIAELPHGSGRFTENICKDITVCLTAAIDKGDVSVQLEALDILSDLLTRFGSTLVNFHEAILNSIIPQLQSSRQAVRKRTIAACGCLVQTCTPIVYTKLINHLYSGIQSKFKNSDIRTYIHCISTICRHSRLKFGKEVDRFASLIFQFSNSEDEELKEMCLQTFESFIYCCPKEIKDFLPDVMSLCCKYISYDPNYNYDDGYEDGMETDDEEEEQDDSDQEDYSDNDDISWKIRRASAKCLEAIVSTRHELLKDFYKNISPMLISRFKEREENVKSDIIQVYIALLRQTKVSISVAIDPDLMEDEETPTRLLQTQISDISKAISKQMKERSIKTRHHCLHLIREICGVVFGAFSEHTGKIVMCILGCLNDKNSTSSLKIEALTTLYIILTMHNSNIFYPHMHIIIPAVVKSVNDNFYKISSEALNVLRELVKIIRPLEGSKKFDEQPFVKDIFQCTLNRLQTSDMDQEVKDKAISTIGYIICHMGDLLRDELPACWSIILDRLMNEITRLTTVKALTKILSSPFGIDIPIIKEAIPILGNFLRKNHRGLKQNTLVLINTLLNNDYNYIQPDLLQYVLVELPALIHPSDLYVAQWTLVVIACIVQKYPTVIKADLLTCANTQTINQLLYSPMLQGACLKATLNYFEILVQSGLPITSYKELMNILYFTTCERNVHKQVYYNVAKCLAAITVAAPTQIQQFTEYLIMTARQSRSFICHMFALIILGELGRKADLSFMQDLPSRILESFTHSVEEIKFAASYALGGVTIGNLNLFLPYILLQIEVKIKLQYLLLHSLKDVIVNMSATPDGIQQLTPYVPSIWQQLFNHCESEEEGTRNVVAECLGKLIVVDAQTLLRHLQESVKSPSPLVRSTVVTAFKYTITDQPHEIDQILRQVAYQFLTTLQDDDYNVRHVALRALNSAAHNKPILIRDLLPTILPLLYEETKVKKELIREVEMGPFKHIVDDGLDMRKAAFECMYTLIESSFDKIDVFEYLTHVEEGLKDHYDIKILTYLIICRLAQKHPTTVLHRMDKIIEPMRETCTMKLKVNAVKQEHEKQEELKRSAMRAVLVLMEIPEADKNPYIVGFMSQIKHSPELKSLFESIQKDSQNP